MDHTVLPANNTMPAFPLWAFTRCHHHSNWGSGHPIAAQYRDTMQLSVQTAEPIEMPFWLWAQMGPRNHVLDGAPV